MVNRAQCKDREKSRPNSDDPNKRLFEVQAILLKQGLMDSDEEVSQAMLEDLVHFAYFTGCISKKEVRRLLALTEQETLERVRLWKKWQDGNRNCNLRQNPFYEGWKMEPERTKGDV